MWSWQTAWWDQMAAWGLLAEGWRGGESAVHFFGTVIGVVAGFMLVFFVLIEKEPLNGIKYKGSWLSRAGKRMSVITGTIAAGAAAVLVITNLSVLLLALLATYPLASVVGVLVLGPIMMLLGRISWRKPDLSKMRKAKRKKSPAKQNDSSQDEIIGEHFHTVEYEGEKILRPN